MDWPARSPDLNPIEHVWHFLGRRLAARTLPPVTIRELRLALQDEWAAMPQQLIDTLILSMGRRCETCLEKNADFITNDNPGQKAAFLSRWESTSGESATSFPEDTFTPYSGFKPKAPRWNRRLTGGMQRKVFSWPSVVCVISDKRSPQYFRGARVDIKGVVLSA
ncbi:transposable element Tcb2 transposase [Trichonephila clavipes]|nr:transposable element Tcb2 transposase [Trichonephila clavipes]